MSLGQSRHQVKVVPYQPEWANLYAEEADRIRDRLGDRVLAIEHIGSTAVSGLDAKPIIDIGIGIHNFDDGFELIPLMVELAYIFRGEVGVPRRHFFIRGKPRTHHVHMYEISSEDWSRRLAFRDHLRSNPEAMKEYRELKVFLAKEFPRDIAGYSSGKAAFIERISQTST